MATDREWAQNEEENYPGERADLIRLLSTASPQALNDVARDHYAGFPPEMRTQPEEVRTLAALIEGADELAFALQEYERQPDATPGPSHPVTRVFQAQCAMERLATAHARVRGILDD
jgi:hypothetical protein